MSDATIIVGKLNDDELRKSIDNLVSYIGKQTDAIKSNFDGAINAIEAKVKGLGKVDANSTAAESTKRATQATKELAQANKEGKMSFDEILGALQMAQREVKKWESRKSFSSEDLNKYSSALARVVALYEQLNTKRSQQALANAEFASKNQAFDAKALVRDFGVVDDRLKELNKWFAELEKKPAKAMQAYSSATQVATSSTNALSVSVSEETERQRAAAKAAKEHAETIKEYVSMARQAHSQNLSLDMSKYTRVPFDKAQIYPENDARAKGLTIEQQIEQVLRENARIYRETSNIASAQLETEKAISSELEKRKKYQAPNTGINESFTKMVARAAKIDVGTINSSSTQISKLTTYLKQLQTAYSNLTITEKNSPFGKQLREEFQQVTRLVKDARRELERPINLKSALALPQNTIDQISDKIRQLQSYKRTLNFTDPSQASEIKQVDNEVKKLTADLNKYMASTQKAQYANNALTRSWNYMKNRLAFYFTVGASTQFVRQLIEVRSQYELNERALGILVDSAERGSKIFSELSQMALVSPYTLIELSAAAKQLTAYDIAAKDVVDTTRRLADMAAAVGVPIERLTYALGQIKAYGYLNSRDNRMFANAGIPLVKQLSEYYTELEGRLVSTADIYDRIKNKTVTYENVVDVINRMTDEGGKFFDFQAKMADTLKVRLANLTLAWNNMLNDIGGESQGVITSFIEVLKNLFVHWREIEHVLKEVVLAFGAYKAYQIITTKVIGATNNGLKSQILAMKASEAAMLRRKALTQTLTVAEEKLIAQQRLVTAADYQNALSSKALTKEKALLLFALNKNNKALQLALMNMRLLTIEEAKNVTFTKLLKLSFDALKISISSAFASIGRLLLSNWWLIAIAGVYELVTASNRAAEQIKEVNRTLVENAKETSNEIKEYLESENTKSVKHSLYDFDENNNIRGKRNLDNEEAIKNWEEMRDRIIQTSNASNIFLTTLEAEVDVNERLRQGFDYLDKIKDVAGVMKQMSDEAIKFSTTTLWGIGGEGLKDDLKDLTKDMDMYYKALEANATDFIDTWKRSYTESLEEFSGEVKESAKSVFDFSIENNFDITQQREAFERSISVIAQKTEMSARESKIFRIKSEEEYYEIAKAYYENSLKYQQGKQREATKLKLEELEKDFGAQKSLQESFFDWLSDTNGSKVKDMLRNKTKEEIAQGEWLKGENAKWVEEMARKFSKEYGVSFDNLHRLVLKAGTWSIHIPVYFDTIFKTLTDVQKDYEKRTNKNWYDAPYLQNAKDQVEIIKTLQDEQEKLQTKITTAQKAGGEYWEKNKKSWEEQNQSLIDQIHAYNALTKAEENAQKKTGKGGGGSKKDVVGDLIQKHTQLITDMGKRYKEYLSIGYNVNDALTLSTSEYGKSLSRTNKELEKFGIATKTNSELAKMDIRDIRDYFTSLLQRVAELGSAKGIEELEKRLADLNNEIAKLDYKKITDSLNNELSKLKEDYELGVELSADPELGNMFATMFNLDVDALPKSFTEALDMANKIVIEKLKEMKVDIHNFGLLDTLIEPDKDNRWAGLDFNSTPVQDLIKYQKTWRDMFKKIMVDTEKDLDDYVKKYGGYSDKIAEIEADRLEKLKRLNDVYHNAELKNTQAYRSKLMAIEQGATKERNKAEFEEFKNSNYYVAMFENLEYASTASLNAIHKRLSQLKESFRELTPEQLKWVTQQYEKNYNELLSRNPFKNLTQNVKNYIEALKNGKAAEEAFLSAQKDYDEQNKVATMWKEILKFRERGISIGEAEIEQISKMSGVESLIVRGRIAEHDVNNMNIDAIEKEVAAADELLAKLLAILNAAEGQKSKYDFAKKLLTQQGKEIAKVVGTNLQSLGALRDFVTQDLGIEISEELDGMVDGLTRVGDGVNQIVSSLENADFVGALVGVGKTIYGIYDSIASVFGGGSAYDKKITRQIEESQRAVKRLENSYKNLEHTASRSYGAMTSGANSATKANKELQLAELQRQLMLEKSRKKKNQDQDKIMDLEGQIFDLKNELNNATRDIVNDLLGISSAGDGIEGLVSVMIDAFRNGEDAMEAFGKKWDEMIDNMILKLIVSTFMQKEWDKIMDTLDKREEMMLSKPSDVVAKAQAEYDKILALSDIELARYLQGGLSMFSNVQMTKQDLDNYRESAKAALVAATEQLNKASYEYTQWTFDYMNTEGREQMTKMAELLKNSLGEWYTFGENNEKNLSALQAGIQGITEETAGAVEAYLNSISQQVYLQSSILTQIRDAITGINTDVQTATQAQMLLQLQNNYILMQTMSSLMNNWTVPSGNGIRVELIS